MVVVFFYSNISWFYNFHVHEFVETIFTSLINHNKFQNYAIKLKTIIITERYLADKKIVSGG